MHLEYFTTPEQPEYINHAFPPRLTKSQTDVPVRADALLAAGIHLDVKCSDGLCVARGQKDGVIGIDL